jgi:hypothetical protein
MRKRIGHGPLVMEEREREERERERERERGKKNIMF